MSRLRQIDEGMSRRVARNFDIFTLVHLLRLKGHYLTGGNSMLQPFNRLESQRLRDSSDVNTKKQQLEEKMRAVEEISMVIIENAARREIVAYITDRNARPVAT
jgi:hypothetical protein